MASSNAEFFVRELETYEIEDFRAITRQYGLLYEREDVIRQVRENLDRGLLVAARRDTGKVIGTCCAFQLSGTMGEIVALAAEDSGDRTRILEELLSWATACLSQETDMFMAVVPNSLQSRVTKKLGTPISNIKSYTANTEKITPPTVDDTGSYQLRPIDYSNKRSILIGDDRLITIDLPLPHEVVSYEVRIGEIAVGYGIMFESDVDKWVVGPIYASSRNVGKYIMRNMLLTAKERGLTGDIITYIYDGNRAAESFLLGSGFEQSKQWGLFPVNRDLRSVKSRDAFAAVRSIDRTVFCIGAAFYFILQDLLKRT